MSLEKRRSGNMNIWLGEIGEKKKKNRRPSAVFSKSRHRTLFLREQKRKGEGKKGGR